MSFISKIGRAFGFGNDTFEDDLEVETTTENNTQTTNVSLVTEETVVQELPPFPTVDKAIKEKIFEGVVAEFNKALPDFLSRSVDPEAQKRLLVESLDKSVDDYLSGLIVKAEQYAEAKLKTAVDSSLKEAEKLKTEMEQLEQQKVSLQESQLSADRRRRALDDRVRDLEGKLATLEAEKEQYQLENKSLLNKLKVSEFQPGVVDEMSQEIERLKKELAEKGETSVPQSAEDTAKIEQLSKQVADLQEQQRMAQAMYNDMQEKYVEEHNLRLETEKKLEEAESIANEFNAFQEKLGQVEEIIQKRDERIEKLSATNRRLRDDNENLRQSLEELNNSLLKPKLEEPVIEEQIEIPQKEEAFSEEIVNEMTAIEDDFECPDWFVADPAPGATPLHTEDPNFGYQEPVRKPHKPESDAQLSLF